MEREIVGILDEILRALEERLGINRINRRLRKLESRMSAVDDIITQLNTATDEIASDLAALRDEVAGGDTTVATKFQPLLDRLTALGADPENPIPSPEPTV